MKVSESEFQLRHESKDKIIIGPLINQAEAELIGGIWTDKSGKIHWAGLVHRQGCIVVEFPNVEISDAVQVGLKR